MSITIQGGKTIIQGGTMSFGPHSNTVSFFRPTGAGLSTQLWEVGSVNNWQNVNDVIDTTSTYNANQVSSGYESFDWLDLYSLSTSGFTSIKINSVRIYAKVFTYAEDVTDGGHAQTFVSFHDGIARYDVLVAQATYGSGWLDWVTYDSGKLTTNPRTGLAWTDIQIQNLQLGTHITGGAGYNTAAGGGISQIYVEIDYSPVKVLTLRPIGNTTANFTPVGSLNNWENVNKSVIDDTTYNDFSVGPMHSMPVTGYDLYTLPPRNFTNEAISGVTIYARVKTSAGGGNSLGPGTIQVMFYDGTTWYPNTFGLDYSTITNINTGLMTINPRTGLAWTSTQLNSLQIGVRGDGSTDDTGDTDSIVYQIYAEITYATKIL